MMNLRRAFTSTKARPTTAYEPDARRGTKGFNASHLPPSPTFPPGQPPGHESRPSQSSIPSSGRTTGVGLRPRAAVQPTMHSRGTILLGTHMIEDEESRRLSEMAFLT